MYGRGKWPKKVVVGGLLKSNILYFPDPYVAEGGSTVRGMGQVRIR